MRRGLPLLAIALCLGSVEVLACSCREDDKQVSTSEKVQRQFRESDFVAEIEIESVEFDSRTREFPCSIRKDVDGEWVESVCNETDELLVARFRVVKLWKGDSATTTVVTHREWQACGLPFRKGEQILLYAYADERYPGLMAADSCGRTNLVANAKKDLKILRGISKRTD